MFRNILKYIKIIFDHLGSKPILGGLQITDSAVQFVILRREKTENFSLRLPEGVISDGIIKNPSEFLNILATLHEFIAKKKVNNVIKIIVSLPRSIIYSQSFRVPYVNEDKLEEVALLNLQMLAPVNIDKTYMDWQKIDEVEGQWELLGVFINRETLDLFRELLLKAKFYPVVFEFSGIGLTRMLNKVMGRYPKPIIVFDVSSEGINFLTIKNGGLYFDYFISWQKIQAANNQITKNLFEATLIEEFKKVSNFTLSRLKEKTEQVIFIAPNLEKRIQELIQSTSDAKATAFFTNKFSLEPAWYSVIGSALRGVDWQENRDAINLSTEGFNDVFFREWLNSFLRMWGSIGIVTMALFFLIYAVISGASALYLRNLNERLLVLKTQPQEQELILFREKAKEFNELVDAVAKIKNEDLGWSSSFSTLLEISKQNEIVIKTFDFNTDAGNLSMIGQAANYKLITQFRNVLMNISQFEAVDLPFSRISTMPDSSINFFLTLKIRRIGD